jgi:hypothetical protein
MFFYIVNFILFLIFIDYYFPTRLFIGIYYYYFVTVPLQRAYLSVSKYARVRICYDTYSGSVTALPRTLRSLETYSIVGTARAATPFLKRRGVSALSQSNHFWLAAYTTYSDLFSDVLTDYYEVYFSLASH